MMGELIKKGFGKLVSVEPSDERKSDEDWAITEDMKYAAAYAIASLISEDELRADYVIPKAFDERVAKAVAKAVCDSAVKTGIARI